MTTIKKKSSNSTETNLEEKQRNMAIQAIEGTFAQAIIRNLSKYPILSSLAHHMRYEEYIVKNELTKLERVGVVTVKTKDSVIHYFLDKERLDEIETWQRERASSA